MGDVTFAYVGVNPGCGCLTAIVVDEVGHAMYTAKDVFEIIASGRRVERHPLEEVRGRLAPCDHPKPWLRPVDERPTETTEDVVADVERQHLQEQLDTVERNYDRAVERVGVLAERIADVDRGVIDPSEARRLTEMETRRG